MSVETNAKAWCNIWCNIALHPWKLEGSLGQTAQDGHLDSHTAPELCLCIIIIDNFSIVLFSGVHKLTAFYNILQHFPSFTNVIHIIMTNKNL